MKTTKALKWRYACKKFDSTKKISKKKIKRISKAFQLTATSFGLFPIKMMIVSSQEIKDSLLEHAFNQQQVTSCSHLLVLCVDSTINESIIDAHFELEKKVRGVKDEDIVNFRNMLKDSFSKKTEGEIEQGIKNQAYIALGNLMTVCAMEKMDTCPMEGFNPQKFDEILKLQEKNLKSVLLLPVGYRAEDDFMINLKKVRKSLDELIISI